MPGTFSPPPRVSDPDIHHGTCVTHVPWCMPGSLTSGFLWSRRRRKTIPAFPVHAQPAISRIWKEAHGHTLRDPSAQEAPRYPFGDFNTPGPRKWPPHSRRHFQMHCLEWKWFYIDSTFVLKGLINNTAPLFQIMTCVTIWTNDDPVYWRIYASRGIDELIFIDVMWSANMYSKSIIGTNNSVIKIMYADGKAPLDIGTSTGRVVRAPCIYEIDTCRVKTWASSRVFCEWATGRHIIISNKISNNPV